MSAFQRQYGVATAAKSHIRIPLIENGATDFASSAIWTPVAGDVQISKDGGTLANIGSLPTYAEGAWIFQLTAAELTAGQLMVRVVDSAAKAVEDDMFVVETYGHISAEHITENMSTTIIKGAATSVTLTTTQMSTDFTEVTNDHFNGRTLIFLNGDLAGQATNITDYVGATGLLTFTAITEAPTDGDDFIVV